MGFPQIARATFTIVVNNDVITTKDPTPGFGRIVVMPYVNEQNDEDPGAVWTYTVLGNTTIEDDGDGDTDEGFEGGGQAGENCSHYDPAEIVAQAIRCKEIASVTATGAAGDQFQDEIMDAMVPPEADGLLVSYNGGGGGDASNIGGAVNGTINGGAGEDILHLAPTSAGDNWTVDLGAATANSGGGGGVSVPNFENARGSLFFPPDENDPWLDVNYDLTGTSGDNFLAAEGGDDTIRGLAGNDEIEAAGFFSNTGGSDNNDLYGGTGDDEIEGGFGDDLILGGGGDDYVETVGGKDSVDLGGGNDEIEINQEGLDGPAPGDTTVNGGAGNDTIEASFFMNEDDPIGNWTLIGGAGDDTFGLAHGKDHVLGGDGIDTIRTGRADDKIFGEGGNDQIFSDDAGFGFDDGTGDDFVNGGAGADHIETGPGDDEVTGGPGVDFIDCGPGDDAIFRVQSQDTDVNCERILELDVTLEGGPMGGDYLAFDSILSNITDPAKQITDMEYPGTGTGQGLELSTTAFPGEEGGLTVESGPHPELPTALNAGQTKTSGYLLKATAPGKVLVRARADGKKEGDEEVSDKDQVTVEIEEREIPDHEAEAIFTGGWVKVLDGWRQRFDQEYVQKIMNPLKNAVGQFAPSRFATSRNNATAFERSMARRLGLPDQALAFMPNDPEQALRYYKAYANARQDSAWQTIKTRGGAFFDFTMRTPTEFWMNQFFGSDPATKADVFKEVYSGVEDFSDGANTVIYEGARIVVDPARREEIHQDFNEWADYWDENLPAAIDSGVQAIGNKARNFAEKLNNDPEEAFADLGSFEGKVKGEIAYAVAEAALIPNPGKMATWIERFGNTAKGIKLSESALLHSPRAPLSSLAAKETGGLPPTAAELGMGPRDQRIMQGVVEKLEEKAARLGHPDVEVQMSFRPRNVHSGAIDNGIGKNQFIKGSCGTELDVILGMDQKGLGKRAFYKPKIPADIGKYPADMQKAIRDHYDDVSKYWKKWNGQIEDASIRKLRRSTRPGGETFEAVGPNGNVTQTIKMELDIVKEGDTQILRYRKLNVDGRKVVDGPPKWVISDYDGDAIIKTGGAALAPAIRGALELEAKHLLTEAAVRDGLAFGFHGFTSNGFDISTSDFRHCLQYILMHLDDVEARALAAKFAPQYGLNPEDFLKNLRTGQYLVKVTRSGATTGVGTPP